MENKFLDVIGCKILVELQTNARMSFTELGRRVGLSTPAVMERVRRMEESGIIISYSAVINAAHIGYPTLAFIGVNVTGDFISRMGNLTRTIPEIIECHRVTGSHSFLLKIVASSVNELERIIDQLSPYVATTTSIVLSSVITTRILEPRT